MPKPAVGSTILVWVPWTIGVIAEARVMGKCKGNCVRVMLTGGGRYGQKFTIQCGDGISDQYGGLA